VSYDPEPEIKRYLERLSRAAHDLPRGRRRELLSEIELHIRMALAQTPCANQEELEALLEKVGAPAEIAAAATDQAVAPIQRPPGAIAFLRGHRPRRLIMTLVALALVVFAIGAAVWTQSYQPLAFARADILPANSFNTEGETGYAAWIGYHKGIGGGPDRPFFGVTIQNTGPFTVQLVRPPAKYAPTMPVMWGWSSRLLMARYTRLKTNPNPLLARQGHRSLWKRGPLQPFQPISLAPGQIVMIAYQGVWHDCQIKPHVGTTTPPRSFPIRFSYLWKTTTAHIPFPGGLTIDPPNHHSNTDCHQTPQTGNSQSNASGSTGFGQGPNQTVVRDSVKQVASVEIPKVGPVALWHGNTEQGGWCLGLRLSNSDWLGTGESPLDGGGAVPGCFPTGVIDRGTHHLEWLENDIDARRIGGTQWRIRSGVITVPGAVKVTDLATDQSTNVIDGGLFILAIQAPNPSAPPYQSPHLHLVAYDKAGNVIASDCLYHSCSGS
jgi:HAAS